MIYTVDLNQFASDLHFCFKYSTARRLDYDKSQELTNVTTKYRGFSLNRVLVRMSEQWEHPHGYFIIDLLKDTTAFNEKNGVGSS